MDGIRARRRFFPLVLAALAAAALVTTVAASADDGGRKGEDHAAQEHADAARIFAASLAPSVPTDPAVRGVAPGAVPWVLTRGRVALAANGRLRVDVRGLVIPVAHGTFPAGTARPVTTVTASLYCAPGGPAAATTGAVPISEDGDASIDETIALPSTCLDPTVLVHPNGSAGAYIALPGWRP